MDHAVIYIVLCFLLPILLLIAYLEKRARRIMVSFCCGVIGCLCAYFINNRLIALLSVPNTLFTVIVSPFVEEFLKFLPIIAIAMILNKGRRGSTANAYAVGIGFCLVENTFFLFREILNASAAWIIFRSIGTGLMHGMSATIIGLGIYESRQETDRRVLFIICTYAAAVLYHALFNFLVQGNMVLRVFGVLLPVVTYILILLIVKREYFKNLFFGSEEVQ